MLRRLLTILLLMMWLAPLAGWAQSSSVEGVVLNSEGHKAVPMAVVELPQLGLWAVADEKGLFILEGVPRGTHRVAVSSLGFLTLECEVQFPTSERLEFLLREDNLEVEEVVVTASEESGAMTTSRTIGSNALDHLQVLNASDILSLLPGGKTVNPDLMNDQAFSLRDGGSTVGNAAFSTAVEVDGVRLSTNASMGEASGASTRSIASTNIEKVEVMTGVPSAEYGDVGSGMVKISTRKGMTPWSVQMMTNPRTKQLSLSKGFDLGHHHGVLNSSVEYARATKNPVSPYTSYSRTGLSLTYSNTFARVVRFSAGVTGNLGGMNSKDDPDAFTGAWERERDNSVRANTALTWLLHKPWITDLQFDGSISYRDNLAKSREYVSNSTRQPAAHSEEEGYYFATMLPEAYLATCYVDSRELDYELSLKGKWVRSWNEGRTLSNLKAGIAWRSERNVGRGEYYAEPELAPHGYRPYPYTEIPALNNLSFWVEELLTLPIGGSSLSLQAGLRGEKSFIQGTDYRHTLTLSPRFNARWRLNSHLQLRGGWGLVDKLPSLGVLYPRPQYTDVRIFDASYATGSSYIYYTHPYALRYNEELRWQRNRNAEVGLDMEFGEMKVALAGYWNRTKNPYESYTTYQPIEFALYGLPAGMVMPQNPLLKVDSQTGEIFVRDADDMAQGWLSLEQQALNKTYTRALTTRNGSPVDRYGVELTAEFPMIRPIRTELRLDAAYGYTYYLREGDSWYYPSISSTDDSNLSYQYVGIYADTGGSTTVTYNGMKSHTLDLNLTATTHIPRIRMVVTLRLEGSLLKRSQHLSLYGGEEYAYNVNEAGEATGGSIYDGDSYTAIRPIAYMDTTGAIHPFTEQEAADPAFAPLILRSSTAYQYNPDGYDPYFSANLSITKEIGDIASISFYANNFTNARRYVSSYATGVRVIRTPAFYYGLTLRLKF